MTDSWTSYVRSKVSKGLVDADKLVQGEELDKWAVLQGRFGSADKTWKQENLKRDEKFEMHFSAAVRGVVFLYLWSADMGVWVV